MDDVYTTGAHLHSAAAALTDGGAAAVTLLVMARRLHREWHRSDEMPWRATECARCGPRASAGLGVSGAAGDDEPGDHEEQQHQHDEE